MKAETCSYYVLLIIFYIIMLRQTKNLWILFIIENPKRGFLTWKLYFLITVMNYVLGKGKGKSVPLQAWGAQMVPGS